ncbi:dimethyladenosine transferase [Kalaharituber pfeilii]|nr:dimethyladenosine transferase [Kalaharituber pfeilii]
MPKAQKKGSNAAATTPYAKAGAAKLTNNVFKMNKDLGQHILKNPGVAQAIVDKAGLKQSDIVLEVGPGTGNLTVRILEKARRVIAVEMDPRMAAEVTKRVQGKPEAKRLEVMLGDVIKTDLPYFDVCISNTPYQISSPLVFKLLAQSPAPRTCVLMFQQEFAMRLVAKPGDPLYCRLSVNAQMWAKVSHVMKVGKGNFKPPPQVESSVVRIEPKVPRPPISYEEWDGLLRIVFVRRNRTIQAGFNSTPVMNMIEKNYRTYCAQNSISLEDGPSEDVGMENVEEEEVVEDEQMDIDTGYDDDESLSFFSPVPKEVKRRSKGKIGDLVQAKVKKVLDETGLAQQRASKCDEADFLKLLYAFNKEGIHFS